MNISGCATVQITQSDAPPPKPSSKKFSEYAVFFIKPLAIPADISDEHNNKQATEIINDALYADLLNVFETLDPYSEFDSTHPEYTLIIEPSIEKLKAVGAGERFLLGALAGGSAVVLKTTYRDAQTNEVIAEPLFYQQANAFSAAYSSGGTDRSMLQRIAHIAATYAFENY